MRFLIVGLIKNSQFNRFSEEAEKLEHDVSGCKTSDLIIESGNGQFTPKIGDKLLSDFDLIYLCAGIESKRRYEWYVACDYLQKYTKTKIVNSTVIDPNKKYYPIQSWFYLKQYEAEIPMPVTYTIYNKDSFRMAADRLGFPVILKLSETHQGKGVFLVDSFEQAEKIIDENSNQTFLVREFVPNDGDIRVFVVGDRAVGAMKRIPKEGEFRSNISRGGSGETFNLDDNSDVEKLALKAAKVAGIEVSGVDIILNKETGKPYVLEVNTGPQFKGLEKYTKVNAAKAIIEYFIDKCK